MARRAQEGAGIRLGWRRGGSMILLCFVAKRDTLSMRKVHDPRGRDARAAESTLLSMMTDTAGKQDDASFLDGASPAFG